MRRYSERGPSLLLAHRVVSSRSQNSVVVEAKRTFSEPRRTPAPLTRRKLCPPNSPARRGEPERRGQVFLGKPMSLHGPP
jgi:hypothetical protein